jgi:hypothetical protein
MDAVTPERMTTLPALRAPTDDDFDNYSAYIAKLASAPSKERPSITPFRVWFFWQYNAFPAAELIHDQSNPDATASSALQVPTSTASSAVHSKPDLARDTLAHQQSPGFAPC